jgi:hypothetical protein
MGDVSQYTIWEPLSTKLPNGTVVAGRLWLLPSRIGSFQVEYGGKRKHDGRTDYWTVGHMRGIAVLILREMAEEADSGNSRR